MYFGRKCVCLLRSGDGLVYKVLKAFCLGLVGNIRYILKANVRYFWGCLYRKLTFQSFQIDFIVKMRVLKNGLRIALNGL